MYSLATMLVALGLALLLGCLLMVGRRAAGLPPGPPTVPILGNIHQMPARDIHLQYQKWANEYGPIYSLILGTKIMIVLSSDETVKDLLGERSAIYSDRLDHYIGQEVISRGQRMLMLHYGPTWRMVRKMVHNVLNIQKSQSYVPYQDLENKQMLMELLDDANGFMDSIRRYTNSLMTQLVYGFRTQRLDDPKMAQLYHNLENFTEVVQGNAAAIMEVFPILRLLPDLLSPLKRRAKQMQRAENRFFGDFWLEAKQKVHQGTAKPCACTDMAKVQEKEGFSDHLAAYTAGTMLEAGSDTTANGLCGFVQAMLLFPDVQRKLQQSIDQVVGDERLPTMDDSPDLPYVRCCMKEALRWMPIVPTSFPHAVIQDDTYRGYVIPKGAGVLSNVYTIHMDPERHPDPRRFDPDRYKDDKLNLAESATVRDASQRDTFVFGDGRRICQGMHVAERSLFLAISRLMWAFDIVPAKDDQGRDVLPDPEKLTQGFVAMPEPFRAVMKPRSQKRVQVIRESWQDAQRVLDPETMQWKHLPSWTKA